MGYKVKISDFEALPDGLYQARFIDVEEREGDKGPYLIWHFEAWLEDEGRMVEVSGISSAKFGPQAKGRQWLDALLSEPLESGEEVDFDSLKNRACQLYLITATTAKGATVNRIDRVIPASLKVQKSKSKAKVKAQDGEPMDEEDVPFEITVEDGLYILQSQKCILVMDRATVKRALQMGKHWKRAQAMAKRTQER